VLVAAVALDPASLPNSIGFVTWAAKTQGDALSERLLPVTRVCPPRTVDAAGGAAAMPRPVRGLWDASAKGCGAGWRELWLVPGGRRSPSWPARNLTEIQ
jgi:hypothetical protein